MPGAAARRQVLGIACWRRARPGCWSCESAGRATCTSCRCRQRGARRLARANARRRRSARQAPPTAYARAQAPPNETPFRCMSRPSKPAAATALEAELRELETQIQRIETVYLSRCGANLVQGEGGARRPRAPRAAAAATRRPPVSPPRLRFCQAGPTWCTWRGPRHPCHPTTGARRCATSPARACLASPPASSRARARHPPFARARPPSAAAARV